MKPDLHIVGGRETFGEGPKIDAAESFSFLTLPSGRVLAQHNGRDVPVLPAIIAMLDLAQRLLSTPPAIREPTIYDDLHAAGPLRTICAETDLDGDGA